MFSKQGIEEIGASLSWDDFKQKVQADRSGADLKDSPWIYRGQSNSKWKLETSLERNIIDKKGSYCTISMKEYYQLLLRISTHLSSCTTQKLKGFDPETHKFCEKSAIPEYETICYLRHYGFPTPVLDWTEDFYIAAFFAFWGVENGQTENVAIYAFKEKIGSWSEGDPRIYRIPHDIENTHARHDNQGSHYTVCLCRPSLKDSVYFAKHEDAIMRNSDNQRLKKFIINAKEKDRVLEELYDKNINTHTLFGDEEALIRMLAYKEFVLGGK